MSEKKDLTISEFLTTVSITPNHAFVLNKMFKGQTNTAKQWVTAIKKVDGIIFKIPE